MQKDFYSRGSTGIDILSAFYHFDLCIEFLSLPLFVNPGRLDSRHWVLVSRIVPSTLELLVTKEPTKRL